MGIPSEIRKGLLCGDCINCKMQVWDSVSKLDDLAKRGYLIEFKTIVGDVEKEMFYLVRCGWTKDNVLQPHKMISCDGKRDFATAKAES